MEMKVFLVFFAIDWLNVILPWWTSEAEAFPPQSVGVALISTIFALKTSWSVYLRLFRADYARLALDLSCRKPLAEFSFGTS